MLMRKVRHFRIHMMEAQSAASCILQPALPAWGATVFRLPADYAGHVGERLTLILAYNIITRFQSTLPVWGATTTAYNFLNAIKISIHTPRMGSDQIGD